MNSNQKDTDREIRSADLTAYSSPKLKVFGPVGVLTQAGSMGSAESNPNGPMTML